MSDKLTASERAAKRRAKRPAKYRNLATHKERMIERRAEQNLRTSYWTQRNPEIVARIQRFCEAMRAVNRKNGVGSPKMRRARQAIPAWEQNP